MDDAAIVKGLAADGLAGLAAPLPGDAPAGPDLRQDFTPQSLYYRLRDARAEAREIERRVDHDPAADAGVPIQWRTVRDLAIKALGEQTKDLEIAAWLTEALVRLEGMSGLAAGSSVIAGLAAALWDNGLHPQPDEEGIETQVAPITGLSGQGTDGTLMQPLRKCVLFPGLDGEPVSYWRICSRRSWRRSPTPAGASNGWPRKSCRWLTWPVRPGRPVVLGCPPCAPRCRAL